MVRIAHYKFRGDGRNSHWRSFMVGFFAGRVLFPIAVVGGEVKNDEKSEKVKQGEVSYCINTDATADMSTNYGDEKYFVGVIGRTQKGEAVCGAIKRIDNQPPPQG